MKLARREFLRLAAAAAALPTASRLGSGRKLSVAAGACDCLICRRRSNRHFRKVIGRAIAGARASRLSWKTGQAPAGTALSRSCGLHRMATRF